jgi:BASS family bile acid:Na+ symporter
MLVNALRECKLEFFLEEVKRKNGTRLVPGCGLTAAPPFRFRACEAHPMDANVLIKLLNIAALATLMFSTGLSVRFEQLIDSVTRVRLQVLAIVANFVLVPLVTVALLRLFKTPPSVAVGFLILAVCPGAPIGPPFTAIAKGNVAFATGCMVLMAGLSVLFAPVLLGVLLAHLAPGSDLHVDSWAIAQVLLLSQLLPLAFGLGINWQMPRWSEAVATPLRRVANALLLAMVVVIVAAQHETLAEVRARSWLGMGLLLLLSLGLGWVCGGHDTSDRKALAITTASRNVAVALVIASTRFAGTTVVTAVVAYGLLSMLGALTCALCLGRLAARAQRKAVPG